MPTSNVKLNRYGNLAGGQGRIKRLLAKKNTFQGTINGVAGVWQRPKRGKRSRGGSGTIGLRVEAAGGLPKLNGIPATV